MKDYLDIGGFIKGRHAVVLKHLNYQYERIRRPVFNDPPRITRAFASEHPHLRAAVLAMPAFLVTYQKEDEPETPHAAYHLRAAAVDGVLAWIDSTRDVSRHKVRQTLSYTDTCTTRDGCTKGCTYVRTVIRIRASTTGELIDEARTLHLPQEPDPEP